MLLVALLLEAGLLLILIPWSTYWDRNYFVETWPRMGAWLTNNYARGAVSGLGLINLLAAVAEVTEAIVRRQSSSPEGSRPDSLPHH